MLPKSLSRFSFCQAGSYHLASRYEFVAGTHHHQAGNLPRQAGHPRLRYPVESVLEYLAAGDSFAKILAEFPDLEREDLLACLEFAAQSLKVKSQHLVVA